MAPLEQPHLQKLTGSMRAGAGISSPEFRVRPGDVFIVSAPPGSGKTKIMAEVLAAQMRHASQIHPSIHALFTLNPGLQGLLELVGGLLLALGLFTRTVAFILAGDMAAARQTG